MKTGKCNYPACKYKHIKDIATLDSKEADEESKTMIKPKITNPIKKPAAGISGTQKFSTEERKRPVTAMVSASEDDSF